MLRKSEAAVHLRHAAATATMDLKDSANVQTQSYMHLGNWTQDITKPPALVIFQPKSHLLTQGTWERGPTNIWVHRVAHPEGLSDRSICMDWLANLKYKGWNNRKSSQLLDNAGFSLLGPGTGLCSQVPVMLI